MISLENLFGKEPTEIVFYKPLNDVLESIDGLKTNREKAVGYAVLAEACKMLTSLDLDRKGFENLAKRCELEALGYSGK